MWLKIKISCYNHALLYRNCSWYCFILSFSFSWEELYACWGKLPLLILFKHEQEKARRKREVLIERNHLIRCCDHRITSLVQKEKRQELIHEWTCYREKNSDVVEEGKTCSRSSVKVEAEARQKKRAFKFKTWKSGLKYSFFTVRKERLVFNNNWMVLYREKNSDVVEEGKPNSYYYNFKPFI